MAARLDRNKSLNELENLDWGEPTYHSYLVTTCHALRRKPLNRFTVEDLRIMIGQTISLSYLVPMAVEVLEAEPSAEADYYPGDLLASVLSVDESFWANHNELFQRIVAVLVRLKSLPSSLDDVNLVRDILKQASQSFRPFLF